MVRMFRMLPLIIAMLMIVAVSVTEGIWTNRWQTSHEPELAAAKLGELPMSLGEWQGQPYELDARQIRIAGFSGYVSRQYVHRRTGSTISVLLACGPSGPMAVHTPDICYAGLGYQPKNIPVRHKFNTAGDQTSEFWTGSFFKTESVVPEGLRISWAWRTAQGNWLAPENPRLKFALSPVLYKCYVVHSMRNPDETLEKGPTAEFLEAFLPEANKLVYTPE